MTKSAWYRWPENKHQGMLPWWTILRRLFFWPFLAVGASVTFLAILGGFGMYDAKDFLRKL
jgi:hypothetical protein